MEAQHIGYLFLYHIMGADENDKLVDFYITYIKNKPTPDATYILARNVEAEIEGKTLILLDEEILNYAEQWKYDPDKPRNLAKTVTVK